MRSGAHVHPQIDAVLEGQDVHQLPLGGVGLAPERAAAEHNLLAWRSQSAAAPRVAEAGALMDAAKVVTTKMPIQLIQNSFISKNVEVGLESLEARCIW